MAISPEQETQKKDLETRPEGMEVSSRIEGVVTPTSTQVTSQVTDDTGSPLIQTPQAKVVTIQLPSDQDQLTTWSKGSSTNALTWFANFWLRIIKKALHFGWRIIGREPSNQNAAS